MNGIFSDIVRHEYQISKHTIKKTHKQFSLIVGT